MWPAARACSQRRNGCEPLPEDVDHLALALNLKSIPNLAWLDLGGSWSAAAGEAMLALAAAGATALTRLDTPVQPPALAGLADVLRAATRLTHLAFTSLYSEECPRSDVPFVSKDSDIEDGISAALAGAGCAGRLRELHLTCYRPSAPALRAVTAAAASLTGLLHLRLRLGYDVVGAHLVAAALDSLTCLRCRALPRGAFCARAWVRGHVRSCTCARARACVAASEAARNSHSGTFFFPALHTMAEIKSSLEAFNSPPPPPPPLQVAVPR